MCEDKLRELAVADVSCYRVAKTMVACEALHE